MGLQGLEEMEKLTGVAVGLAWEEWSQPDVGHVWAELPAHGRIGILSPVAAKLD